MNRAFTLIELLIVIAIIGILAGAITVTLSDETGTAKNATVKLEISSAIPKLIPCSVGYCHPNPECSRGEEDCDPDPCGKIAKKGNDNIEKAANSSNLPTNAGEIRCLSIGQTWALTGKLEVAEDNGDYWCADEDGFRGPSAGFVESTTKASCKAPST